MKALRISNLLCLRKRKVEDDRTAINYKTVGLIGLCSGAGTTQLGVMLANYFSNGLHLKTAIVSSCYDDAFDRIKEEVQRNGTAMVRNFPLLPLTLTNFLTEEKRSPRTLPKRVDKPAAMTRAVR